MTESSMLIQAKSNASRFLLVYVFNQFHYTSSSSLYPLMDRRYEKYLPKISQSEANNKPHALCIPYPAQGHITPMLKLAKLLHHKGIYVSFVNTDFNHNRLIKSNGPEVLFWTASACGLLAYMQYSQLVERGYIPLQDTSYVTNGYLDTKIDWVLGMKDMKLKDFPRSIRTTDLNDTVLNFFITETAALPKARALIINTFDTLEQDALKAISASQQHIYTIGPLHLLMNQIQDKRLTSISSSLWKEEDSCIDWLEKQELNSVVYVNFGSIAVMTAKHLTEFAWGLANSKKHFLWIVRPDIIAGDTAKVPPEFVAETRERGWLASWCSQEQVLKHPAIGGFLTHNGWNSTIESIASGIPVICWPFFAEQQTNRKYSRVDWGIGMEINNNVKRNEVEELVREIMDCDRGKKLKKNALEWKKKAEGAANPGGSSAISLDRFIDEVLLS